MTIHDNRKSPATALHLPHPVKVFPLRSDAAPWKSQSSQQSRQEIRRRTAEIKAHWTTRERAQRRRAALMAMETLGAIVEQTSARGEFQHRVHSGLLRV